MADDKRDAPATPPDPGRRRLAPTIELTATEIPASPPASAGVAPSPEQSAAAAAAEQAQAPAESLAADSASAATAEPTPDTMQGDVPPAEPAKAGASDGEASQSKPMSPGAEPEAERTPPGWRRGRISAEHVKGGLIGASVVLLLFAGLFASGFLAPRDNNSARLARLELQMRELAGRSTPDAKAIDEIANRLAERATKSVNDSAAGLNKRIDDVAAAARDARNRADAMATGAPAPAARDVENLSDRVVALERGTKALEAELAKRNAVSADRAVRLAVAATVLKSAVERGEPFADQLAAMQSLTGDDKALAPLQPFAGTGVPTSLALGRQLSGIVPTIRKNLDPSAREDGFLDRLQANAERLVRIRPVDEVPGDDAATVVNRIEVRAARSDVAGALSELGKLPAATRTPAEDWIKRAEAQQVALEAARRLAGDALIALGKSS